MLVIALLAGCAADSTGTGEQLTAADGGSAGAGTFTCGVYANWNETTVASSKAYRLYPCWLDGDRAAFEMHCARSHEGDRFACVETGVGGHDIPGTWYSYSGGTKTQERDGDLWVIVFRGGTFMEYDCQRAKSELLEPGWCDE